MSQIAVMGCGYWGRNLVRTFAELDALAAVVDAVPETARTVGAAYGAPAHTWEQVLSRDDIVGVVIATPAEMHARQALEALRAGKHVFIEKPVALFVRDAELILAEAVRVDRKVMVGHLLRYHPGFEALLAAARGGQLGELSYAYSHRLSLGKFRVEENALWSLAPHDVSMLLALFDEQPSNVAISGESFITPGVEDACRLHMTFPTGRSAHVFASWLHPFKEQRLTVVGSKAMAVFEDTAPAERKLQLYPYSLDLSTGTPTPSRGEAEFVRFTDEQPLLRECRHFLECIRDGSEPRTNVAEAINVLRVLTGVGTPVPTPQLDKVFS